MTGSTGRCSTAAARARSRALSCAGASAREQSAVGRGSSLPVREHGGYVHPAVFALAVRAADGQPALLPRSIGVIATLARREGVGVALREWSPDEGVLAVLRSARGRTPGPSSH
jgi:hypothetical protein